MAGIAARIRPYGLHGLLAAYVPLLLLADSRVSGVPQQYGLGLLTFAVLWLASRASPPHERRQVWLCVPVATAFEVFGSLIWGLYRYRFHNLPLYVPPGHGLVYLFGLSAVRTPIMMRSQAAVRKVALAVAAGWALGGLTLLPALTGRLDVQGALCFPIFAYFVMRSPRAAVFAAIFFVTSELEIFGTYLGTWTWLPAAPFTHVPSGNPPSVIAGGYCVIDGSVVVLMRLLGPLAGRFRLPGRALRSPASGAAPQTESVIP